MFKRILSGALVALCLVSQAAAQSSVLPYFYNASNVKTPVGTNSPLPIVGSISASLAPFTPGLSGARGTPLTVTTSDSSGNLPTNTGSVIVYNVGSNPMYCNVNAIAATTSDQYISASGGWFNFGIPSGITTLRCIATGGSTTANTAGGSGLGAGTGGGSGGGGGGAVTVADGADVTQGALADAASTAGGTGSLSAKLRLMTTQLGTLNTTLGSPFQAGGSIGNTTFAATQATSSNLKAQVDPLTAASWGLGATGAAVPANAHYIAINSGGNLTGWTGAVTVASGGIASGAIASGAVASGALASGSIAAGAMVDLLTMRQTVAAGTVASNSLLTGGIYNSSPITLTNGQGAAMQFDANGYLKVNTAAGAAAGGTSSNFGSAFPTPGTAAGMSNGTNMVAMRSTAYGTTPTGLDALAVNAFVTNTNANGQATMANSSPVVFASNQSALPVSVASGGIASGAIASGAVASGAVASGAYASGSLASGAVVDITNMSVATGAAPPSKAIYVGANTSGATGGLLQGLIQCDSKAIYDASTNGSTELVALTSGRTIYVCGYSIIAGGTVNVKLIYGTGTACATGSNNMTPAFPLTAQAGISDGSPFYRGLKTASANALCINASAGVAATAIVYYAVL